MSNVINSAMSYVEELLNENLSQGITYHNYKHTQDVFENSIEIGKGMELSDDEMDILKIAALFHDTGWIKDPANHEEISAEIAGEYLASRKYSAKKIKKIREIILCTKRNKEPDNLLEAIILDADILHIGKKNFITRSFLLKEEREFLQGAIITDSDWISENLKFMETAEFKTDYVQKNYEKRKSKNILKLKKWEDGMKESGESLIEITAKGNKNSGQRFRDKNKIGRGVETMFRNAIRTHVEFSSMADSKANIMISVNTLILTAIVAFLAKSLDANPYLIPPAAILTLVSLTTLVYAITVTRPKITSGKFTSEDIRSKKANLLFFGNFHNMKLEDFEWGMTEMIKDSDYLYSIMIRDYYYLGQVLGQKYKKLRICYNLFMYGIIISIIAFAIAIMSAPSDMPIIQ